MPERERILGRELLSNGCHLVDASNRTGELNKDSVLALASLTPPNFTVFIDTVNKKRVFKKLERKHGQKRAIAIIHSVKLFFALKDNIGNIEKVFICADGCNKSFLEHYLKELMGEGYDKSKIYIRKSLTRTFGKKHVADRLAKKTVDGKEEPTLILEERHFIELGLIN